MASTNKTANYNLSQFIGTDKPAWLSDYNQDMSKIDTGIKGAADAATAADGKADANTTAIGDLTNLSTTAKTNVVAAINEVKTDAGTAQNTANTAINNSATNATAIQNVVATLNINTYLSYTPSQLTYSGMTQPSGNDPQVYIARNASGTLFKVYGNFLVNPTSSTPQTVRVTIPNTGISTDTAYTITGCGITHQASAAGINPVSLVVNTDNTITITFNTQSSSTYVCRLFACLYFNGNFGDIIPE